jgi:hypothetical protein
MAMSSFGVGQSDDACLVGVVDVGVVRARCLAASVTDTSLSGRCGVEVPDRIVATAVDDAPFTKDALPSARGVPDVVVSAASSGAGAQGF